MKHKFLTSLLILSLISVCFANDTQDYGTKRAYTEQVLKDNMSGALGKTITNAMDTATTFPPNLDILKQYVSDDSEELYYFNFLDSYIKDPKSIEIKTIESEASNDELKAAMKAQLKAKFGAMMNDEQLDAIVAKQMPSTVVEKVKQTVLVDIPGDAKTSSVRYDKVDMNDGDKRYFISITYNLGNPDNAKEKASSLVSKIKNFLSHDNNWAIYSDDTQTQINKIAFSSDQSAGHNKMAEKLKAQIAAAKARGEDTTYMEQGLKKYQGAVDNKQDNSTSGSTSFSYSWYEDGKPGRQNISFSIKVSSNDVVFNISRSNINM